MSGSLSDARQALVEAQRWLGPAVEETLQRALGELYIRTARRAEEAAERKALLRLYARELSALPGDLVLEAIRAYRGTFFPALDELRGPVERSGRLRERRLKIAAIREFLNAPEEKPVRRAPTDEQRAKMRALAKELSGDAPPEITPEIAAALAEVDRVHGARAKAKTVVHER